MQQDNSLRALNYIVAVLAVLGIAACWAEHWQAKKTFANALIPESLNNIYFKPALLFTALFSIIIMLQALSIYYKKANMVTAISGVVFLVACGICYRFTINWFLP